MSIAFGLEPEDVFATSAKTGLGVAQLLPAIVGRIPPPSLGSGGSAAKRPLLPPVAANGRGGGGGGDAAAVLLAGSTAVSSSLPLRARVVDSWFDDHRGVICLVQVSLRSDVLRSGRCFELLQEAQESAIQYYIFVSQDNTQYLFLSLSGGR